MSIDRGLIIGGGCTLLVSAALPYFTVSVNPTTPIGFTKTYFGGILYGVPVVLSLLALGLVWINGRERITSWGVAAAGLGATGFCAYWFSRMGRKTATTNVQPVIFNLEQGTRTTGPGLEIETTIIIEPQIGLYVGLLGGLILLAGGVVRIVGEQQTV